MMRTLLVMPALVLPAAGLAVAADSCPASAMETNAQAFFDACENGTNWTGTKAYVAEGATFNAQVTDAIPGFPTPVSNLTTVKGYTEWMAGVVNEFGAVRTSDYNPGLWARNSVLSCVRCDRASRA
jgi:hypothetical protein